ncbi:MAG: peptide deformylase [Oscillospiraceae bacterium]|nr:peptide deformylase [Oscillospiraceae bacterium]MBQ9108793.1 peptide deformylase [Oscillospiraceae bacterium]
MAYREILTEDNPRLRKVSRPVENFDKKLHDLLDDMLETMDRANGVGLAAPQVGILRRAVVIDIGDGPVELINPRIIAQEGEQDGQEGCLSCPGKWGMVKRPYTVTVEAYDRDGQYFLLTGSELMARAICHECAHLDGELFVDVAHHMLTEEELEELED